MEKRVLITAGASGIGWAIAEAFAALGAQVWVTDIDEDALEQVPNSWRRSLVNVADEAQMAGLFEQVARDWSGVDVLCANAGIAGPTALVETISLEDWKSCISVNLEGAFLSAKYAIPLMKAQKSGAIILTSSTAGLNGFPNRAPYASAKWAVIGLMKTLAMELGPFGVRVNAICPGAVEGPRLIRPIKFNHPGEGPRPLPFAFCSAGNPKLDRFSLRGYNPVMCKKFIRNLPRCV